jgi:hypothetical protein
MTDQHGQPSRQEAEADQDADHVAVVPSSLAPVANDPIQSTMIERIE